MNKTVPQVIGLHRLELKQGKFKSGALYISAICAGNLMEAIDIRFFAEDGNNLIPTRQGFRIYSKELGALKQAIAIKPVELLETVLWEGAARKLIARYCDDDYGRAVDFRYFKSSKKYTGWEPRGIRLQIGDYEKLQGVLTQSNLLENWSGVTINLFEGKEILSPGRKAKGRPHSAVQSPAVQKATNGPSSLINDVLSAFINDL